MRSFKKIIGKILLSALLSAAFMVGGNADAEEQTLKCTLYVGASMDSDAQSSIEMKDAGLMLKSGRRTGVCVFDDGQVADKQWVFVTRAIGDGSTASEMGYSVYTMDTGESVFAKFAIDFGSNGASGVYTILGGTGNFEGATGDGSITGTQSPWATTPVVKIVLNVKTP